MKTILKIAFWGFIAIIAINIAPIALVTIGLLTSSAIAVFLPVLYLIHAVAIFRSAKYKDRVALAISSSRLPALRQTEPRRMVVTQAVYALLVWVIPAVFTGLVAYVEYQKGTSAQTIASLILGMAFIGVLLLGVGWVVWKVWRKSREKPTPEDEPTTHTQLADYEKSAAQKIAEQTGAEKAYFNKILALDEIKKLDPLAFERFVGGLFEGMGYEAQMTRRTGDEGVDLLLRKDGRVSVAQCKRYGGSVGQSVVRDLYGTMVHNKAREAFLVTTGTITMPAQQWAMNKPIHLLDGVMLVEWVREQKKERGDARIKNITGKGDLGLIYTKD